MNRVFAVGDIHGCFDTFHELLMNRIRLGHDDRIILLGDYIDRGDKSREVIDYILNLQSEGFDLVTLAGNHEVMLLEAVNNPEQIPLWLMNSGESTLKSFGAADPWEIGNKYLDFFKALKFFHREGNFVFVHAGLNDNAEDPFTDENGMIWESRLSYSNPMLEDLTIVHGHRPKTVKYVLDQISSGAKVIPVDTGCVYGSESGYGFLSALEIFSMELTSVARK
jgi:serine/threonine protein phosphatase 1